MEFANYSIAKMNDDGTLVVLDSSDTYDRASNKLDAYCDRYPDAYVDVYSRSFLRNCEVVQ